jgi:hypothetical protein
MTRGSRGWRLAVAGFGCAILVSAGLSGCVFRGVRVRDHPLTASTIVRNPFKVHLRDGSVVVFQHGGAVGARYVTGSGTRLDATRQHPTLQDTVPLDSVLGIEVYQGHTNVWATTIGSLFGLGLTAVGTAAAAVAIFGSCPTFYVWSDSLRDWRIEAESFSTSVGPAFEARDVDRVSARPGADGMVRLEGRNEALETHYLNQLALIEVRHAADETAFPDPRGVPIVVASQVAPLRARDRAGRDVLATLRDADGDAYATDPAVLRAASETDLRDTLELAFPPVDNVDSVALVFRMRNSLLTTVLLYDVIMGDLGPEVLDWFPQPRSAAHSLSATAYAALVWPTILVRRGADYVPVAYLNDAGPLAWRDVAVMIPVLERDSVVVRLTFPLDVTRIDRIALGTRARRTAGVPIPVHRVLDRAGREIPGAVQGLAQADTAYAVAEPGQAYRVEFAVPRWDRPRTFFLAATGYYIEWARPSWFHAERHAYAPTAERLVTAMRRWQRAGAAYEERFYAQRVPVR